MRNEWSICSHDPSPILVMCENSHFSRTDRGSRWIARLPWLFVFNLNLVWTLNPLNTPLRSPGKRLSSNRQNLISKCTLVYPQSNKKYFNFINLLTFEEIQFPGRSFSCNLMGKKRYSNNCERWISVKVVLKKIEHVLLYFFTKMQKTAKNYHVTLKY